MEIGDALEQRERLRALIAARRQRVARRPVVAERILVRIGSARLVAGDGQQPGPSALVRAEGEVVRERDQILAPFRGRPPSDLERLGDAAVQFRAPLDEQVLIDHVVEQRLRESEARSRRLVDELGVAQQIERGRKLGGPAGDATQGFDLEGRSDDRGLLENLASGARQPIEPRQEEGLDARRNLDLPVARDLPPSRAVADKLAVLDQAADDLLDEQGIAAGTLDDAASHLGRKAVATWLARPAASAPASNSGRWVRRIINRF